MSDAQQEIWLRHTAGAKLDDILAMTRNPCGFQAEFAHWLNTFAVESGAREKIVVCEAGSGLGVTSLLLDANYFEKHCLDLNPEALALLKAASTQLGQNITLHHEDMFKMSVSSDTFDILFNNGVLEHYTFSERVEALAEYRRVTKPNGRIFVGVPNHDSPPYRASYLMRTLFNSWPYPLEHAIDNLDAEIQAVGGLRHSRTLYFDKESVFWFLPKRRLTLPPFKLADRFMNFPPYLKVFEILCSEGESRPDHVSRERYRSSN